MKLTQEQYMRYSRQLILPDVQGEGQEKIFKSKVLLVGLGGLGSPQALYLAAAGVGHLGLLDGDRVDLTNLQRQVIHFTTDLKAPKVLSAQAKINALNPDCDVQPYSRHIDSRNAMELIAGYDIIVDCTDNFPARYLLNDACVLQKKPLVHGAVYRFEGQATVFYPAQDGPCYRCLYPVPPSAGSIPSCAEAGVMGTLPGTVGMIQAAEVIKLILGKGDPLIGRLLFCDLMTARFQELAIQQDPGCPVCGKNPTIQSLADYEQLCELDQQERMRQGADIASRNRLDVISLNQKITDKVPLVFLDIRQDWERALYPFTEGIQLPFNRLAAEWESLLPYKDQEIVVCCLFGWKSREAVKLLTDKGFNKLWTLDGGLEEWSLYQEKAALEKSTS